MHQACNWGVVKMAKGQYSPAWTLTEVKHVPDLRKNMILLGMLDSRGCKLSSVRGILKSSKRDKFVLQGQMIGNLYRLVGRIVTDRADIKYQTSSMGP